MKPLDFTLLVSNVQSEGIYFIYMAAVVAASLYNEEFTTLHAKVSGPFFIGIFSWHNKKYFPIMIMKIIYFKFPFYEFALINDGFS